MKTFKRVGIYLGIISLTFLMVDRALAYVLTQIIKESEFRFSKLYRGGLNSDIIILGNSRSVNAFFAPDMERELGKDVFHLGFNGMSMEICESVLEDYLSYNEAPDCVVLEITNMNVGDDQLKDQKIYTGMSSSLRALMARKYPVVGTFCQWVHSYRFNSELFLRSLYYYNRSDQSWINGGTLDVEVLDALGHHDEIPDRTLEVGTEGWLAMQRIIALCQAKDVRVKLIVSPYFPKYVEVKSIDESIDQLKDALSGTELYDFSRALSEPELFADVIHINRKGSQVLLQKMLDEGVFDQRYALTYEENSQDLQINSSLAEANLR